MQALTHKYLLPLLLAGLILSYWLFSNVPALDIAVSRLFFADGAFWGQNRSWLELPRQFFWNLSLGLILASVIALSLSHSQYWPQRILPTREWNVIFWSFVLGPGILVNAILKSFSGRPRPVRVLDFDGTAPFRAVGEWNGICANNCSFVSGEVSSTTAFCLSGVILIQYHSAWLGPQRVRALYAVLAGIFAFVFMHRIVTGGHFLSDAIFAALLTALVTVFVAALWPKPRH